MFLVGLDEATKDAMKSSLWRRSSKGPDWPPRPASRLGLAYMALLHESEHIKADETDLRMAFDRISGMWTRLELDRAMVRLAH